MSQASLNAANRSNSINILPAELLVRIFALATASTLCSPKRKQDDILFIIPAVCKLWRQLAVGAKSLWSHIDIHVNEYAGQRPSHQISNATQLWLRRAHGTSVHIHFNKHCGNLVFMLPKLIEVLQPHASAISSLTFSFLCDGVLICAILRLCVDQAAPRSMRRLAICGTNFETSQWDFIKDSETLLSGLTSLQIGPIVNSSFSTMKQLATVLACSPRLQTLWLQENAFYYDKDQELPKVHLPCLRALALVALNISILPSLLRILSVGTHELYMRLEFYSDKESLFAARAFLERSRVASLYLSYRANDVMDDPSILPYLHTIYLNLRSDCVARLCSLVILTEEGSFIPRCTTARSLYFLDGNFSEAAQEQIVLVTRCYPLTEIHFLHCGFQLESDSVAWRHADDPVGQDLYDCLVRQVAKVTILYPSRPNTGWDPVLERETIS